MTLAHAGREVAHPEVQGKFVGRQWSGMFIRVSSRATRFGTIRLDERRNASTRIRE